MTWEAREESWRNRARAVRDLCSTQRKQGKYPFFAEQALRQALARIPLTLVSQDETEALKVEMLLRNAEDEVTEEEKRDMVDFKKDVDDAYQDWCRREDGKTADRPRGGS